MNYGLIRIAEEVAKEGGTAYLVGGFVRDKILGLDPKDYDVEVFGLTPDALMSILSRFGEVDAVGKSFGVFKLRIGFVDFDISLPRRESKNGRGHKGFMVEPDPSMTLREAAMRRDLTMNSLSQDIITDEMFDFFGGVSDIENGILRHTSEFFGDDPLRVLRLFQFLCRRRELVVAKGTVDMCAGLLCEYDTLSLERIWGEWEKWATKSVRPSTGLKFLVECGWIKAYPELNALIGVPQSPVHHPEGDVWNHTLMVVDESCSIRPLVNDESKARTTTRTLSALLHDVGKPGVTEIVDGKIRTYGHGDAGIPVARSFLESIGAPGHIIEYGLPLIREHMARLSIRNGPITGRLVRRLARRLHPSGILEWVEVVLSDHRGRLAYGGTDAEDIWRIYAKAKELKSFEKPAPILMGRHLLDVMTPGPAMGVLLGTMYEHQLDGHFKFVSEGLALAARHLEV